jgi:Arc/MetJ-type ribon-helix-helix transcriptional regulator
MVKKRLTNINVRVPTELKALIENQVQQGLHVNISDFVREAIRNKLHTRKQQSRAHNHLKHFPRTQTGDENDG